MKYKVGDEVRIIGGFDRHRINIGKVVTITARADDWYLVKYTDLKQETIHRGLYAYDIEPINQPKQIELGKRYKSFNDSEWECIAVKGDTAWLVGVYCGEISGPAFVFKTDGTCSSFNDYENQHRIKFTPIIKNHNETVKTNHGEITLTYQSIDGVPDWDTAKVSTD